MSIDWTKLLRGMARPKSYIKPVCPICHEMLKDVPLTDFKECKNGHRFGPGMKRVPLINDGDHHGDL